MAYGDVQDVRRLSGIGTSTAEFTDPDIAEEQEAARDIIDSKTGRSTLNPWVTTDPHWQLVQRIENLLAASLIIAYGGPAAKEEAERLWTKGMSLLDILVSAQTGVEADTEVLFSSSSYLSYPLGLTDNEDTVPHRSTRKLLWT